MNPSRFRSRRLWGAATAVALSAAGLVVAAPAQAASTSDISVTPGTVPFGDQRVGTFGNEQTVTVKNTGPSSGGQNVVISSIGAEGADPDDFPVTDTTCVDFDAEGNQIAKSLAPQATCTIKAVFAPVLMGGRTLTLDINSDAANGQQKVSLAGNGTEGYYLAGLLGETAGFGDAIDHGDATDQDLNAPIVDMAATTGNGDGYWLLGLDGGIFSYGNAKFYGSTGGMVLNAPVLAIAPTPDGGGYWLAAADGGIFSFGTAKFFGSMGGKPLNKPIVGIAATPTGNGYWLVASDGGIFAFGDAKFFGSRGGQPLNQPIRAMGATPTGNGYWFVATDGGIFSYGDAKFFGSTGSLKLNQPITDFAVTPTGHGYWLLALDGGIFAFGDAPFQGSLGGSGVDDAIGIAGTAPTLDPSVISAASTGGPVRLRQPSGMYEARSGRAGFTAWRRSR